MLCRVLCALLFVAWTAERPGDVMYYADWRSPFEIFGPLFISLPVVRISLWHLLVLAMGPLCLLGAGAFRRRSWPMDAAMAASFCTVALTFFWGVARGGSAYQSYYQLRSFLIAIFVGILLLCAIRNRADVRALAVTVLAAALVRGTLATYFFVVHVWGQNLSPYPMFMTSHADSLLFVSGFVVVLAWALARKSGASAAMLALAGTWLIVAIKVNNRRLAWVELVVVFVFAYLLLRQERRVRQRMNFGLLVAAPLLVLYVVVGWGRHGPLFAPLRAFYTTTGESEDASSIARNEESLNLVYTFQRHPLLGTGWGHPYLEVSSTYTGGFGERFWQYPFLPHNSLVGIAAFSGIAGLVGIWIVVPVAAFLAARAYRHATRALDRAAAMAVVCFLPAYGIDVFGDIGFQGLTSGLLLSVAMALAGKVSAWTGAWPTEVGMPAAAIAAGREPGRGRELRPAV
jgi:hypothetical protein